jgi:hypothetical protein
MDLKLNLKGSKIDEDAFAAYMKDLSEESGLDMNNVLNFMKESGINVGGIQSDSALYDNQTARKLHLEQLQQAEEFEKNSESSKMQLYRLKTSGVDPISSGYICKQEINKLKPVSSIKELEVGQINKGFIIRCTVVEPVLRMTGILALVEDTEKQLFQIGIYNFVDSSESLKTCQKILPIGCKIGVKEPYVKRFLGGIYIYIYVI